MDRLDSIIEGLSLDDLCGQVLCYNRSVLCDCSEEEMMRIVSETKPGGVFVYNTSKEKVKKYSSDINTYTKIPVIIATDAEHGPGGPLCDVGVLPQPMAWGACDDEDLIERAGRVTAELCRKNGIQWSFAPLVDINYNPNNPGGNIRTISDSPQQVAKIAGAYMRGMQNGGYMAASCKHFPGDGTDDRNQHFCTIVNSKSKEEWMETYGYVYKEMMQQGLMSVMVAHIAAPAFQEDEYDQVLGYKPATLSRNLITDLLKKELGFEGCVVSDAMCMVGACSMVDPDLLAVEFLRAGGDMVLFALPGDFYNIKNAVKSGYLPIERLKDAVKRILKMKDSVHLLENQEEFEREITISESVEGVAREIAEKSINVVRNAEKVFPLKLNKGAKILMCNLQADKETVNSYQLTTIRDELTQRGYFVQMLQNPGHSVVESELAKNYDAVLINCRMSCRDYCGGSLRTNWEHIALFWRGRILKHPKVIFTSFGDPYKLYEYPFMKTYINTFSNTPATQKAFVKALLGEIPALGKSPVALKGFFERTVK